MGKIVLRYIKKFLGYGHPKGKFQFCGMEEGRGDDRDQVEKRFRVWNKNGRRPTEDLIKFQPRIGIKDWFVFPENPKPKPQKTWKGLIRIYLNARGVKVITPEKILKFQTNKLGRKNNPHSPCLFELMPLPSPRLKKWPYQWLAKQRKLKFLKSRSDYKKKVLPIRMKLIQKHIQKSKPKVICFYGMSYLRHWKKIAGTTLCEVKIGNCRFYYARKNGALFIAAFHPAPASQPPPPDSYFDAIGRFIRRQL